MIMDFRKLDKLSDLLMNEESKPFKPYFDSDFDDLIYHRMYCPNCKTFQKFEQNIELIACLNCFECLTISI